MSQLLSLVLLYAIFNVSVFVVLERICTLLCTGDAIRVYKRCWSALATTFRMLVGVAN